MKRKEEICSKLRRESNHLGLGFVAVHVGKVLSSNQMNICLSDIIIRSGYSYGTRTATCICYSYGSQKIS